MKIASLVIVSAYLLKTCAGAMDMDEGSGLGLDDYDEMPDSEMWDIDPEPIKPSLEKKRCSCKPQSEKDKPWPCGQIQPPVVVPLLDGKCGGQNAQTQPGQPAMQGQSPTSAQTPGPNQPSSPAQLSGPGQPASGQPGAPGQSSDPAQPSAPGQLSTPPGQLPASGQSPTPGQLSTPGQPSPGQPSTPSNQSPAPGQSPALGQPQGPDQTAPTASGQTPSSGQSPTPGQSPAPGQPTQAASPKPPGHKSSSAGQKHPSQGKTPRQPGGQTPMNKQAGAPNAGGNSTTGGTTNSTGSAGGTRPPQPGNTTSSTTLSSATNSTTNAATSASPPSATGPATAGGKVSVTEKQFTDAVTACGFPAPASTKYNAFIQGIPKSSISSLRELAMFLANILHESDGLRATSEIQCQSSGCKGQYDAAPNGVVYFGRGYTQLTWAANYKAASKDLYNDENKLASNPDIVAKDENIAWDTAFWYWKTHVHTAAGVTDGKFGASIKAINGAIECSGGQNPQAKRRFDFYGKTLKAFGVNEAPVESGCYN